MSTLEEIIKETEYLKGTLVVDMFRIVLFLEVVEGDNDYYYNLMECGKRETYLLSCVGGIVPLQKLVNKDDYEYLVRLWNMNNEQKAR